VVSLRVLCDLAMGVVTVGVRVFWVLFANERVFIQVLVPQFSLATSSEFLVTNQNSGENLELASCL